MSSVTQAWLESPSSIKGILVEVTVYNVLTSTTDTLYLSNIGYMTTDSLVSYNPVIIGGVKFTESLSVDGSASLSFGDIEVINPNGDLDSWLDSTKYIWVNRTVKVYLGDPLWVCANLAAIHATFELVFDGVIGDVDSRSRETINITVRDKLERLNTPITESTLGAYGTWSGGQPNIDTIKPLVFGEVFNIEPILINPASLEYMFNDGSSEALIEIRDNGVPIHATYGSINFIGATVNVSNGTYTLLHPLVGVGTCSVQGVQRSINLTTGALVSSYSNNIANLIALITMYYGTSTTRFSVSDLDLTNLAAFASANTQAVGILITDKVSVLDICQQLARSIGAQVFVTRQGKLQLLRLETGIATTDITDDDILHHSLSISSKTEVVAATKLGYCTNYTVQDNLLTIIPPEHKDSFSTAWWDKLNTNSTVKTNYKLDSLPDRKETLLIVDSDVVTETARVNAYFNTPRIIYRFTGTAKLMSLVLGQHVTLTHNRFNLSSGPTGQVISLSPNWLKSTIDVEVII